MPKRNSPKSTEVPALADENGAAVFFYPDRAPRVLPEGARNERGR